jgi:hypothetical protein
MRSQVRTHGLALDPETYDPIKEYRSVPNVIKQMSKAFFGGVNQK